MDEYAELVETLTGWEVGRDDMIQIAGRIINVYKALNVRAGIGRESDYPPDRMFEPIPEGPHRGKCLDRVKYDKMLNEYYKLHNWDPKTGIPTRETLQYLGLREVAKDLNETNADPEQPPRKSG